MRVVALLCLAAPASAWRAGIRWQPAQTSLSAAAARSLAPLAMADDAETQAAPAETLSMPPESFQLLVEQAATATLAALEDGQKLMEVEFPPLPISKLEDTSLSSYDILSANLQLSLAYVKKILPKAEGINRIALTLPDLPERKRAAQYLGDEEPWTGTQLWSLVGGAGEPSPLDFFSSLLKQGTPTPEVAPWADMYIILGATCQELPVIALLSELAPEVPIVCFNLKLDVLRGDLGLPAFPPRAVHHTFLSRIKPVYLLRPRSYTLSLARPPFLLSYSGVLYRRYPEGFQTLLDKGRSNYRRVNCEAERPALGNFKAQLAAALKVYDEDAQNSISQAGYKQSTWWEDDENGEDVSDAWRT